MPATGQAQNGVGQGCISIVSMNRRPASGEVNRRQPWYFTSVVAVQLPTMLFSDELAELTDFEPDETESP